MFCAEHLWCWGWQPKHVSNSAYISLNHIVFNAFSFWCQANVPGLRWLGTLRSLYERIGKEIISGRQGDV